MKAKNMMSGILFDVYEFNGYYYLNTNIIDTIIVLDKTIKNVPNGFGYSTYKIGNNLYSSFYTSKFYLETLPCNLYKYKNYDEIIEQIALF